VCLPVSRIGMNAILISCAESNCLLVLPSAIAVD